MDLAESAQQGLAWLKSPERWPPWVNRLLTQRLPRWLAWLILLAIAYQLAAFTWMLAPQPTGQRNVLPAAQSAAPSAGRGSAVANYRQLAQLHLFGKAEPQVVAKTPVPKDVTAITPLNLTLYGVFRENDFQAGFAIIGRAGGAQQRFYRVGQDIQTGVSLQQVHADHVVISNNGKFERLQFPKDRTANQGGVGRASSLGRPPPRNNGPSGTRSNAQPELARYREEFKADPSKILKHLRFVPVRVGNNQVQGYRLLPQRDRTLYNKLKLTPSDIVTAVNGIPLNSEAQSIKALTELSQADEIVLEVNRRGQPHSITLNLR